MERASVHESVLVVHDTTEFRFGGAKERRGLGRLNASKREGFLAHYSICVSPSGEPLGSLELFAWSRLDDRKRQRNTGSLRAPDRESQRWLESAQLTAERLYEKTSPIHVMDREGDQFELFAGLCDSQQRFVIRLGHDRRLSKGRGKDEHPRLNETLASGPAKFVREVELGRRERDKSTNKRAVFPERSSRKGRIEVRAKRIDLYRSHQRAEHLPDCLTLNFVEAREVDAPPDTVPVVWRLVTTEAIETREQVEMVIDNYRKRWIVEEFFKAIKTGCRFESHQLEDAQGLLVALSIESALAWQILRLRYVSRQCPEGSGEHLLTERQRSVVVALRTRRGEDVGTLSVADVVAELARLGAHIPNNGPPGWLVLKRGLRKLNMLAEGLSLAHHRSARPDVINR